MQILISSKGWSSRIEHRRPGSGLGSGDVHAVNPDSFKALLAFDAQLLGAKQGRHSNA